MRAIVLDSHGDEINATVKQVPIPQPRDGEVLIRMEASPINPSDLGFIAGTYSNRKEPPVIPGFEGSGTVVSSSGGLIGWSIVGKRVAVAASETGDGCWAEFMVAPAKQWIQIPDDVAFENGACSMVNPLTVWSFVDICKKRGYPSAIHTAAASSLGKMLVRACIEANIQLINVVRRQEQVDDLKRLGAEFILNSSDEDFQERFNALAQRLDARVAFECVCGDMTGSVVKALAPNGTCYVYGSLTLGPASGIDQRDLLVKNITIEGLILTNWLNKQSLFTLWRVTTSVASQLNTTMSTKIARTFDLEQFKEAIEWYKSNMSAGKVIIKPSKSDNSDIQKLTLNNQTLNYNINYWMMIRKQKRSVTTGNYFPDPLAQFKLRLASQRPGSPPMAIKDDEQPQFGTIIRNQQSRKTLPENLLQKLDEIEIV